MYASRLESRTGCDRSYYSLAKQEYTFLNINFLSYVYRNIMGKNAIMNSKSVE